MPALYSFEWLLHHNGKVIRSQRSLYYNEEDNIDQQSLESFVRNKILKKGEGTITIQNIKEVQPEMINLQSNLKN